MSELEMAKLYIGAPITTTSAVRDSSGISVPSTEAVRPVVAADIGFERAALQLGYDVGGQLTRHRVATRRAGVDMQEFHEQVPDRTK
ncbi:hypothetical protein LRK53_09290 [Rhodanobacter thiooxydans]|nr:MULTISPECIES: hypothetical protein [Rhodanobacter]UJJ53202.1 hypothetical protein LRK53_09290 [Rhodanobacter thiooxydans]